MYQGNGKYRNGQQFRDTIDYFEFYKTFIEAVIKLLLMTIKH